MPEITAKDFLTVVKVLHFNDGVKFWYLLSNLDFDWMLVHRKPSLTWPSLIYLANRLAAVGCIVSTMVGLNVSSQINCQAWITMAFLFPLLELEFALLLIVVRVVAIWKRSNIIVSLNIIALATHSGVSLHLLTGIRSIWDSGPDYKGCIIGVPRMHLVSMSIATIMFYAFLLTAMFVGLLRQRQAGSFGLWKMLSQQGWVWFALAVAAEVPTLTLVLLNIDPALNLLFQVPRVVIASIGTTTMFRMLYNYSGRRPGESGVRINVLRPVTDSSTATAVSSQPLKVSVHTATDNFGEETTQGGTVDPKYFGMSPDVTLTRLP